MFDKYITTEDYIGLPEGVEFLKSSKDNLWVAEHLEKTDGFVSQSKHTFTENYVQDLVKLGWLIPEVPTYLEEETDTDCVCHCDDCARYVQIAEDYEKYRNIVVTLEKEIGKLRTQYRKDNEEVRKSFEAGVIAPTVHLEANTVYYNIDKILKHLESKISDKLYE